MKSFTFRIMNCAKQPTSKARVTLYPDPPTSKEDIIKATASKSGEVVLNNVKPIKYRVVIKSLKSVNLHGFDFTVDEPWTMEKCFISIHEPPFSNHKGLEEFGPDWWDKK